MKIPTIFLKAFFSFGAIGLQVEQAWGQSRGLSLILKF